MAYCRKCGKEIDDEAVVCVHCGVPQSNYSVGNVNSQTKNNGNDPNEIVDIWTYKNQKMALGGGLLMLFIPLIGIIGAIICFGRGQSKAGTSYLIMSILIITLCSFVLAMSM